MLMRHYTVTLVILSLGLSACVAARSKQTTLGSTNTAPTAIAAQSNKNTAPTAIAIQSSSPVPAFTGKPPQTNAAELRPPERREELSRLSNLLKFKVTGLNGAELGQVSDFIINTCETYIIYFVVDPAKDLKVAAGHRLVIPFEVVTINSGALEAEAKVIALYLTAEQVAQAPAFPDPLPLFPNNWEETVRAYWLQVARVSPLTSECKAGGSTSANAVHKIAYASQLLDAELKDGNHNLLGTVVEAILEPESGKLGFYVVNLQDNGGLVMVPLGMTNIPEAALKPGNTIELVLLAENQRLLGAPRIGSVEQAASAQTQNTARQYWGQ